MRLVPVTPGASAAREVKARPAIGRFGPASVVDGEGTLGRARLHHRRLGLHVHDFSRAANLDDQRARRHALPGLTCRPDRLSVLNEDIDTSTV